MKKIFYEAISHFGIKNQKLKAVEELNELAVELVKSATCQPSNVEEELADAIIMIEQMKILFPNWKKAFKKKRNRLSSILEIVLPKDESTEPKKTIRKPKNRA